MITRIMRRLNRGRMWSDAAIKHDVERLSA